MKKLTLSDFIEKSNKIHENKYGYDLSIYKNSRSKIIITCKDHGSFNQIANDHLSGKGCPKCSNKNITTFEIVKNFIKIHGNKYDYSKTIYKNSSEKLCIICPNHGEFFQTSRSHLKGSNCPKCKTFKTVKTFEIFVEQSRKIHKNKYEYLEYKGDNIKIKIKCNEHGLFLQTPSNHLQNHGCPKCVHKISKPEIQIQEFLKELGHNIQTNKRGIIGRKELDIYIPELRKAIEFNGRYWHYSDKYFVPGKHAQKSNFCKNKNINLLYIREDLWLRDTNHMKSVIKKFLEYEK